MKNTLRLIPIFILLAGFAYYKTQDDKSFGVELENRIIVDNLETPWEILWGPDNQIWITERDGRISKVNPLNGSQTPIYTIPEVRSRGEGGLLGMILHPDFKSQPYVYVAFNYEQRGDYREKVVRYSYNGTTLTNAKTIIDNISAAGIHNGCRLIISSDKKLFITTGDAANQSLPQNISSINGKVLRLNLDGTIPADNPISGSPVWSFGHRNAQGLVFVNNILFVSEHGPDSDDEINVIEKGRNYGWPNVKGSCNTGNEKNFCSRNNVKEPVTSWSPTIAVCGMDYYNNSLVPEWKNSLLLCTLREAQLIQLKLNAAGNLIIESNILVDKTYGRLRDVCISPAGKVYICTSNGRNDKIIEVGRNRP